MSEFLKSIESILYGNPTSEVAKSFSLEIDNFIEKANEWGRKIPVKKQTSDGRTITYWVSPEDLNQGKMKGAQNLFVDEELNQGPEPEESYFSKIDKDMEEYRIKPLVEKLAKTDPGLSKRINSKYEEYLWGRDTKELDVDLDEKTLEYMNKIKKQPELKKEHYEDFLKETDNICKKLNNRKLSMARLKLNSKVKYKDSEGKITGFTRRGYPIVTTEDGEEHNCFVDEIVNLNELIEKYGKAA